ncbi:hypothetical protein G3578_01245 [Brevibacillus sp. SYP-B805]|uniref:hypothetical protein n=1 Tax=Brevibacillus sp. SYP-B805 TaxID=1578199 RepID=UPI0013ED115E|nr:hypothetical protein [Brevibacillus sp. SYP-B805]NGQ93795.1 hypothetical protein [Brevibacillus sp. SYP-B805]
MTRDELVALLQEKKMTEVIELIEDAEAGELEELELVEGIGLLYDEQLNREVLALLESLGVTVIYLKGDDLEGEEEDEEGNA